VKIHNEISLRAPADELFAFLSDVERVGPCLPGATIDGREGDDYTGRMKVKVGPINATYQGKLRFVELDKEARRAVMRARADEVNGQGNAEASITTEVEDTGGESVIRMDTDLQMRGKVAQFGRGAMEKISQRMFEDFARNIEQQFQGNGTAAAPEPAGEKPATGDDGERPQRAAPAREPAPAGDDGPALDVLGTFGGPALTKAGPVVLAAALAFAYGVLVGRLRESRATVQRMARLL
jgi:carbon monoxide dehydrogenase subunit G